MLLASILLSPIVGYYAYHYKSRSFIAWFMLAFIFNSVIIFMILFFLPQIQYEYIAFRHVCNPEDDADNNLPVHLKEYEIYTNNKKTIKGLVFTIQNIGEKTIDGILFMIEAYDANGEKLIFHTDSDALISIDYISIKPSATYANDSKAAIQLPDASIERIHLNIYQVLFADGSVVTNDLLI